MNLIYKHIRTAEKKYISYMSVCGNIARKAQEYIDWNDDVSCEYYPGDGICIRINEHVCPATSFFALVDEFGIDKMNEVTYNQNCI